MPELRRPVRPARRSSRGLRQLERRKRTGGAARLRRRPVPGRSARHQRARTPSRAPTTASSRSCSRTSPKSRATRNLHPAGLLRQRRRQRHHPGHRRERHQPRLGRVRLRRGEPRQRSRRSRSPPSPAVTAVSPTVETIADGSYPVSRGLYIYVNNGQGGRRTRPSPATSTSTSVTAIPSRRDQRPSVTPATYVLPPDDLLAATDVGLGRGEGVRNAGLVVSRSHGRGTTVLTSVDTRAE